MKYLKRFNESIEDIDSICREYEITNYTINLDGLVDVEGDVDLSYRNLTRLPLKFGKVSGDFNCSYNQLTTLEGCPTEVGGGFGCSGNQLTTLEGCPENMSLGGYFYCDNNQLTTLEGCPTSVGGNFFCGYNKLTTLEGCPTEVGGGFYCHSNKLTTLEGCPTRVGGNFYCFNNQLTIINWNDVYLLNITSINLDNNPIYEVYKLFPDFKTFKDSLEWNYFRKPNIIFKERFVEACEILEEETGIKIKIPKKIKGYTFE